MPGVSKKGKKRQRDNDNEFNLEYNFQIRPYIAGFYKDGTGVIGTDKTNHWALLMMNDGCKYIKSWMQEGKTLPKLIITTADELQYIFDTNIIGSQNAWEAINDDFVIIEDDNQLKVNNIKILSENDIKEKNNELLELMAQEITDIDEINRDTTQWDKQRFSINTFLQYNYHGDYHESKQRHQLVDWVQIQMETMNENTLKGFWWDAPTQHDDLPIDQASYALLCNVTLCKDNLSQSNSANMHVNTNPRNVDNQDFIMLSFDRLTCVFWNFSSSLAEQIPEFAARFEMENQAKINC